MSELCDRRAERAIRVVLWTGGNAPSRDMVLTVEQAADGYAAYYANGYCGCGDCHPIVGRGRTAEAAVADYWTEWEERR